MVTAWNTCIILTKENAMDGKEMKRILASLGIATLVSTVGATMPGHLHAGSG